MFFHFTSLILLTFISHYIATYMHAHNHTMIFKVCFYLKYLILQKFLIENVVYKGIT